MIEGRDKIRGTVRNGMVELRKPHDLPEGAEVLVRRPSRLEGQTVGERLMHFAGRAVDLPSDAASRHDEYLYGTGPDVPADAVGEPSHEA